MEPEAVSVLLYAVCILVGAGAAWGGAYAAMRIELRHLWREMGRVDNRAEKAHTRLDEIERDRKQRNR
jgi:hypothetical protein